MNKLLIASVVTISIGLGGCNTTNNPIDNSGRFVSSTVGSGVQYTANTIGAGVGFVGNTGVAVGKGMGSMVSGSNYSDNRGIKYNKQPQRIYRNGHYYRLHHGQYVPMN